MSILMEDPVGSFWMHKNPKDKLEEIVRLNKELFSSQRENAELANTLKIILKACDRINDPKGSGFNHPHYAVKRISDLALQALTLGSHVEAPKP